MILLLAPIVLVLGAIVWWVAIKSRRSYVCPSCGNAVTVEHMSASNCNVCGAPLREVTNQENH